MHEVTVHHDDHDDAKITMAYAHRFLVTIVPSCSSSPRVGRRRVQPLGAGVRLS
jgi:hypothetical protein